MRDEEIEIYVKPNCWNIAWRWSGVAGGLVMPQAQYQQLDVLRMEKQVLRRFGQWVKANQGPCSSEQQTKTHVYGAGVEEHCHQVCSQDKILTPTAERAVIESLVSDHQLSRCKACKIVCFSQSALYKHKTDWAVKDAPVIDTLNEIIDQRSRWGFRKFFTRMRKDGKTRNHKKVHRAYCDMKLNLQRRTKNASWSANGNRLA